jgi:hypothetical protein
MTTDNLDEEKFDALLKRSLQNHKVSVPDGFTENVLESVRQAQQQEILRRVIFEERLTLTACITLTALALIAAMALPLLGGNVARLTEIFTGKINEGVEFVLDGQKLYYVIFAAIFIYVAYALMELLEGDTNGSSNL